MRLTSCRSALVLADTKSIIFRVVFTAAVLILCFPWPCVTIFPPLLDLVSAPKSLSKSVFFHDLIQTRSSFYSDWIPLLAATVPAKRTLWAQRHFPQGWKRMLLCTKHEKALLPKISKWVHIRTVLDIPALNHNSKCMDLETSSAREIKSARLCVWRFFAETHLARSGWVTYWLVRSAR